MKKEGKHNIGLKVGYATLDRESGDCALSCRMPEGRRALILSDGMGHGARAALRSRPLVNKLRHLLQAGVPAGRALVDVNKYFVEKGDDGDGFATVDLTVVDEISGKVNLYKMGAAPTFVVNGRRIRKLQRPALPAGITGSARPAQVVSTISPGDIIVMVSDGITDCTMDGDSWIRQYLRNRRPDAGPRQLAEGLLKEAVERYGQRELDDATVIVAIVHEMENEDEETSFTDHQRT